MVLGKLNIHVQNKQIKKNKPKTLALVRMGVSESRLKAMKGVQVKLRSDLKSHTEYTDLAGKILKSSSISIYN